MNLMFNVYNLTLLLPAAFVFAICMYERGRFDGRLALSLIAFPALLAATFALGYFYFTNGSAPPGQSYVGNPSWVRSAPSYLGTLFALMAIAAIVLAKGVRGWATLFVALNVPPFMFVWVLTTMSVTGRWL